MEAELKDLLASPSPESWKRIVQIGKAALLHPFTNWPTFETIVSPAAASGETWPMDNPEVPPEKRPSVTSAHALPSPMDFR